jgi:ABC-type transporter Mla MlaB component
MNSPAAFTGHPLPVPDPASRLPTGLLTLVVRGPLDPTAVEHIRRQVARLPENITRLRLDCSGLSALDPVGVAAVWRLCEESRHRGVGVRMDDVPPHLARRLRSHPVMAFISVDPDPFQDPFASLAPSLR